MLFLQAKVQTEHGDTAASVAEVLLHPGNEEKLEHRRNALSDEGGSSSADSDPDEVPRQIDAADSPFHRARLGALYGTGTHRTEVAHVR